MENNCFFGTVLRSLGYKVYPVGARVHGSVNGGSSEAPYSGFSHMVNLVRMRDGDGVGDGNGDESVYMVDVGFGSDGPVRPLLLRNDSMERGIGGSWMRLRAENIADNTDSGQKLWVYATKDLGDEEWRKRYCFTELEFLPQDYEMMNFYTSTNPRSWFTQVVVVLKMIMEEGEIVGTISMLGGEVKRRVQGRSEVVAQATSERNRVMALEEWFGVKLQEGEIEGIKGLVTQLRG